jgi:hypothetical protein
MSYATDGKCHASEPGTFNHECGKPAAWVGARKDRTFRMGFCDACARHSHDAKDFDFWLPMEPNPKDRW